MTNITESVLNSKQYLIEQRRIDAQILDKMEQENLISYQEDYVRIVMRDLDGNETGRTRRFTDGRELKTKVESGAKVSYFYTDAIDFTKPVIVVEGDIDWLTIGHIANTISIPGITNLKKLVKVLLKRGAPSIYLLVDCDDAADKVIGTLLYDAEVDLNKLFDSRITLGEAKDINELHIKTGLNLEYDTIIDEGKVLSEFDQANDKDTSAIATAFERVYKQDQTAQSLYDQLSPLIYESSQYTNFYIFPVSKRVEFGQNAMEKVVTRDCIAVLKDGFHEQRIEIDSDWFVDQQNFRKELMKKKHLQVEGKKTIGLMQSIKLLFDTCEELGVVNVVEEIGHLGYTKYNTSVLQFTNCKLDLLEEKMIKASCVNIKIPHKIEFRIDTSIEVSEALAQFNIGQELLVDESSAYLLNGFLVAGIWRNEVMQYQSCFPGLYIFGLKGTGKSVLMMTLSSIVGYVNSEKLFGLPNTTKFSLLEFLANIQYFSFLDEYQWFDRKPFIDELLKANYDNMMGSRGAIGKSGAKTNYYSNNSVLIYGGEGLSNNEALITRSVILECYKGATKHITEDVRKQLIQKYQNLFFNILQQKQRINFIDAITEANGFLKLVKSPIDPRLWNNLRLIIAGNILLGETQFEKILPLLEKYLLSYDQTSQLNNIANDVVDDVLNSPDVYISLSEHITKQAALPLFIYNNKLYINLKLLTRKYLDNNHKNIDHIKLMNELGRILGIIGKFDENKGNYEDFLGRRHQHRCFLHDDIQSNSHLKALWNAFVSKIKSDYGAQHLGNHDGYELNIQERIQSFLDTHHEIL